MEEIKSLLWGDLILNVEMNHYKYLFLEFLDHQDSDSANISKILQSNC